MRRLLRVLAAPVVAATLGVTLAGCGDHTASAPRHRASPTAPASRATPAAPTSRATSAGAGTTAGAATKVLVVIEENHSYAQMRAGMPFLAGLSQQYGYATHWTALAHPSLPNYLGIVSGSTFGIRDDASPAAHAGDVGAATTLFDLAAQAGKTAATYAEDMPAPCSTSNADDPSTGAAAYAVRHNPWTYFPSSHAACQAHDLDTSTFTRDAAADRLPDVGLLIPSLPHDAHDGSLATADTWLRDELTPVLASSDFTTGRLVVVVTADEDDRHSGNTVLTSVLTPRLSHAVATAPLTHYSLTRYIAQVLGVPPPGQAAGAPDLRAAFGL